MKFRRERPRQGKPPHDPTPEEIQRQCQAIRRTWSEKVFRKRAGIESVPLTVAVAPPYFEYAYVRELV